MAGTRLDRVLADGSAAGTSRSRVKALIEAGHARIDGATVQDPSRKVKAGETVTLEIPDPVAASQAAEEIPLSVVFEDAHLIVIDKPAGLVVHPAPGHSGGTLVNALLAHCKGSLSGIGGVERPGIVHRLDKDTSGLMVAAKTDAAHRDLAAQFASHTVERVYAAIVKGVPRPANGEIEGNIGRNPRDRKKMAVVKSGGKEALTRYRTLETLAKSRAALIECRLATGRTHQIRVHLASINCPLLGDPDLCPQSRGLTRFRPASAGCVHARVPPSGKRRNLTFRAAIRAGFSTVSRAFARAFARARIARRGALDPAHQEHSTREVAIARAGREPDAISARYPQVPAAGAGRGIHARQALAGIR